MNPFLLRQLAEAIQAVIGDTAQDAASRALAVQERTQAKVMPDRLLLSVRDIAHLLSLGHSKVEQLIASGELRSIKLDGSRRVTAEALREYIEQLEREQNRDYWQTKSEALQPGRRNAS